MKQLYVFLFLLIVSFIGLSQNQLGSDVFYGHQFKSGKSVFGHEVYYKEFLSNEFWLRKLRLKNKKGDTLVKVSRYRLYARKRYSLEFGLRTYYKEGLNNGMNVSLCKVYPVSKKMNLEMSGLLGTSIHYQKRNIALLVGPSASLIRYLAPWWSARFKVLKSYSVSRREWSGAMLSFGCQYTFHRCTPYRVKF